MRSRNLTSTCNRWPGLGLFVSLPTLAVSAMLLIGRQSRQPASGQDAVDRRAGDGHLMKPLQVARDPARSEVVLLPQVHDLAGDVVRRCLRATERRSRAVAHPSVPMLDESPPPLIERLS